MNPQLIKIEFKGHRRHYYANVMEYPIVAGDWLIVQTEKGEDIGRVTAVTDKCPDCTAPTNFHIVRKALAEDMEKFYENRQKESEAQSICLEKIGQLGLDMKLMDVEYQLDRKKITFYYTADERVDFRELVRLLAAVFRTRIEMRQIGVRDEAKRLTGFGTCGLPLCCGLFLEQFEPVNTQSAKDQNLPMNPSKLSGQCGKLKCCLRYELPFYQEEIKRYPQVGNAVHHQNLSGFVEKNDVISGKVICAMENETHIDLLLDEALQARKEAVKRGLKDLRYMKTVILDGDVSDLKRIQDE
jgi:cell fate regulator YaaT (PSP1 superfamily)